MSKFRYSVFTKPWKTPIREMGAFLKGIGLDGVELCVRPGYQVEPDNLGKLPGAVKQLADCGIVVESIAGSADVPEERVIAACAEAGVSFFRTMIAVGEENYLEVEKRIRAGIETLVPALDRYGVKLGIQNHCGTLVANCCGLRRLLDGFDPKHVVAVWDQAHNGINGEEAKIAFDLVESHLGMVNLKNAYRKRVEGASPREVTWQQVWTTGWDGFASWPSVAEVLKKAGWSGVLCLGAAYTDSANTDELIKQDVEYVKSVFEV